MDVKRGIDAAVQHVKEKLIASAKKVKASDEIAQVGTISANGEKEIGGMIAKAMQKVGNEGVITVEEAKSIETELDVVEGMQFDRGYLSPYFITNSDKMTTELDNPYILLQDPRSSSLTFSSLNPKSWEITWPPVNIAISSSIAFLLSPNPGAFTATTFKPPLNLFTTKVANASPSTSSEIIIKGLPDCTTASNNGTIGCKLVNLLSCNII